MVVSSDPAGVTRTTTEAETTSAGVGAEKTYCVPTVSVEPVLPSATEPVGPVDVV